MATDPQPALGSLKIVPSWDGTFHIMEFRYDMRALVMGHSIKCWDEIAMGFDSVESARERVVFMGRIADCRQVEPLWPTITKPGRIV